MIAQRLLRTKEGGGLGLEIRFALVVGCIASIMAGIACTGIILSERAARITHDGHAGAALAGIAITEHRAALLAGAGPERDAALAKIEAQRGVERAELYDANGALAGVRAESNRAGLPAAEAVRQALSARAASPQVNVDRIAVTAPILDGKNAVGALRLVINRESLSAEAPPSALPGLLVGYLLALLVGAPVAMLMAQRITRPLERLTAFSKSLSTNHRNDPIELKTGDEFETLAGAYNAMIARFEDSMRRIERLAFLDPATDLPNLAGAHRIISEQIQLSVADRQSGVVFVLRVERLDSLLEMIGNDRSQDLIGAIGARLRQRVRAIDQAIRLGAANDAPSQLARMTGPDFCVVTPSFASGADAARFAQRLAAALSQPLDWRDQTFSFGGRVGASVFPRDGEDPDTLIRHATLAVGAAGSEPGRARFFAREMEKTAARRIAVEREIRAGIDQRQFVAHFQPKIDLAERRVVGAEALARWILPSGAIIGPAHFIQPAEEFGLIGPISEAILLDSCWKGAAWAREGEPVMVSVNVSPLQLLDDKFTERVQRAILDTGMPPEFLELEITESVALTNPERANRLISPLKDMGVSIALDDFGIGHSSLSALSKLPFDVIKIDQSFVRALDTDQHAPAIIETILMLADRLGCSVVAEGVETEREAEWLLRRGCTKAQGFLFGAALPPHEFRRMQLTFGRTTDRREFRVA